MGEGVGLPTGLAGALADYVSAFDVTRLPPRVVERTVELSISAIGAAVRGATMPITARVASYARSQGGRPEAAVIGLGFATSIELAGMLNCIACHETEYEDVAWPEAQYTCCLIPAAFTVGEAIGASGADVIAAIVAGMEIAGRPVIDGRAGAQSRGFLGSAVFGTLGAAAAAGRLLKLGPDDLRQALCIAASTAAGLLRQSGSDAHVMEPGFAARNGIAAAMLAARGLGGNPGILEGPGSLYDAILGHHNVGFAPPEEAGDYRVMAVGQKKYPCGYHLQRILDPLLDFIAREDLHADDIEEIVLHTGPGFARTVRYLDPATPDEARLSLGYVIGAAVCRRAVDFRSFTAAALNDPAVRATRDKIRHIVHGQESARPFSSADRLELVLIDGRRFEAECRSAHGDPDDPLTREETIAKYRLCVGRLLPAAKTRQVLTMLCNLADLPEVGGMMRLLSENT